jgi:hypothetical protein
MSHNRMISMRKYRHMSQLIGAAILVGALLAPTVEAGVRAEDTPERLIKALSIYKKEGIQGFINALVRGSPMEGNQVIRKQVLILEKLERYYGAYLSYDIVHINTLSDSTRLIYFMLNYEKGPVFGRLTAFRNGDRETITSFQFHTKAEEIFPEPLLVSH